MTQLPESTKQFLARRVVVIRVLRTRFEPEQERRRATGRLIHAQRLQEIPLVFTPPSTSGFHSVSAVRTM